MEEELNLFFAVAGAAAEIQPEQMPHRRRQSHVLAHGAGGKILDGHKLVATGAERGHDRRAMDIGGGHQIVAISQLLLNGHAVRRQGHLCKTPRRKRLQEKHRVGPDGRRHLVG